MQRTYQRLHKSNRKRLRRPERRWRFVAARDLMPRDEALLAVTINEQRLTQREAMVLPDRDVNLHGVSPTPVMWRST